MAPMFDNVPLAQQNSRMYQAPLEERLDFYRYMSAKQLFAMAKECIDGYAQCDSSTSPPHLKYSLLLAFIISYAKPFKEQRDPILQRGLRLPPQIVPPAFADTHEAILQLRDKMFAHTDFASFVSRGGEPLNALRAFVLPDGHLTFGIKYITPRPAVVVQQVALTELLVENCSAQIDEIWQRWSPHLGGMTPGANWKLNFASDNDDVLIPA